MKQVVDRLLESFRPDNTTIARLSEFDGDDACFSVQRQCAGEDVANSENLADRLQIGIVRPEGERRPSIDDVQPVQSRQFNDDFVRDRIA